MLILMGKIMEWFQKRTSLIKEFINLEIHAIAILNIDRIINFL